MEILSAIFVPKFAAAAIVALLSGIFHGYTGFGGALLMVPLLSLLFGPLEAVKVTAIAGFIGMAQLVPPAVRIVKWAEVGPVIAALVVTTPLGGLLLIYLDPEYLRRTIGTIVALVAILLMTGWVYRGPRGTGPAIATGSLCGVINGFSALGGPPIALYFLAAPDPVHVQRANIVIVIAVVISVLLASLAISDVFEWTTLGRGLILSLAYFPGTWIGSRLFKFAPEALYRKVALLMLVATGITVLTI